MQFRRKFLATVGSATTVAVAGCSEADLDDIGGDAASSEEETADDESDADELTDAEAAVDQYRTAVIAGDADEHNGVVSEDGEIRHVEEDQLEEFDGDVEWYELREITTDEYQNETEDEFDQEQADTTLADTGGEEYTIVEWTEEYIFNAVRHDYETYILLHEIDGAWLLIEFIDDSIDTEPESFTGANSPEAAVEQYLTAGVDADPEAGNRILHPEDPDFPLTQRFEFPPDLTPHAFEEVTTRELVLQSSNTADDLTEEEIQQEVDRVDQVAAERVDETGADDHAWVLVSIEENGDEQDIGWIAVQDDGEWYAASG